MHIKYMVEAREAEDGNKSPHSEFLASMDLVDKAGEIAQRMQGPKEARLAALKERDDFSLEGLLNDPYKDGKPLWTQEYVDSLGQGTEEEKNKKAKQKAADLEFYFPTRQRFYMEKAVDLLYKNGDNVLKGKDGKFASGLEKAVLTKEVLGNIEQSNVELVSLYANYGSAEELLKKLGGDMSLTKQEMEFLNQRKERLVNSKIMEYIQYCREELGWEGDSANIIATLASRIYSGFEKKDQEAIAKSVEEEAEKELKQKAGDNYRETVAEIAAKALVKMVKSKNHKEQQAAVLIAYQSIKGKPLISQEAYSPSQEAESKGAEG